VDVGREQASAEPCQHRTEGSGISATPVRVRLRIDMSGPGSTRRPAAMCVLAVTASHCRGIFKLQRHEHDRLVRAGMRLADSWNRPDSAGPRTRGNPCERSFRDKDLA
jgi:hypothetical protein